MKSIINNHHLIYENKEKKQKEVTESVFKGEHEILSKLNWYTRKKVSKGLIKSLKLFIVLNEDRAITPDDGKPCRLINNPAKDIKLL